MEPLTHPDPRPRPISGLDLLDIPYNERWEHLKTIIIDAYLGHDELGGSRTLAKLAQFMKDNHGFSAQDHQYRFHFKKWGIRKRTITTEKKAIVAALGKRSHAGASTSDVTIHQGGMAREVERKRMRRFLNDEIRRHVVEQLMPGMFAQWNLPYAAFIASVPQQANHASPFGQNPTTPQYLSVNSPEATTPGGRPPVTTPTTALIRQATLLTHSNLLLQGRRVELLSGCNDSDRRVLSGWLHDYWMYSFVTAKFWGRGPQQWTAGLVSAVTLGMSELESPYVSHSPAGLIYAPSPKTSVIPLPTSLCRWAIHHERTNKIDEQIEIQAEFDLNDQSSWTPWPTHEARTQTLQATMEEAFAHNRFSEVSSDELPISGELVAQAVSKSPEELALDSVAFAIMSGNLNSVIQTLRTSKGLDFNAIRPYHLAASFLDGGNRCCLIMDDLIWELGDHYPIALNNVNDDGHTVLDSLMVSILRSHTNLAPSEVSSSFNHCTRFPGEEKDICGRWDANTPEVRRLHQEGHHRIPQHWKHNFCHSAVQAVCHSMLSIYIPMSAPWINVPSGLFRRRCTHCGLEMKLGPIHVVVAVAFYLADRGMDGETLFGAVACAVCLLVLGADAALRTDMSVMGFLTSTDDDDDECRHRPMTASELMEQVPLSVINRWKSPCKIGWKCLFLIIQRAAAGLPQRPELEREGGQRMLNDSLLGRHQEENPDTPYRELIDQLDCDPDYLHWHLDLPCIQYFGPLWASIQTELRTYRAITSSDPSISTNFRMDSLQRWLEGDTAIFETPLITDKMMKEHSECGWFDNVDSFSPMALHVPEERFTNMDIWGRLTQILLPNPNIYNL